MALTRPEDENLLNEIQSGLSEETPDNNEIQTAHLVIDVLGKGKGGVPMCILMK